MREVTRFNGYIKCFAIGKRRMMVVERAIVGGISAPIRMLQGRRKGVARVLQGCYKGVARVLQGCYKGVIRVLQGEAEEEGGGKCHGWRHICPC
jgi:hypothetical protein